MDEWQKEHPAPDLATATLEERYNYQTKVMKFKNELDTQYGKEHPEYAYYKQQSLPRYDFPDFSGFPPTTLPDRWIPDESGVIPKPIERIILFRNYNSDPMSKYYL